MKIDSKMVDYLVVVGRLLGGWFFDEIKTKEERKGYLLSNREGLFISVTNTNKFDLKSWSLWYKDHEYNHIYSVGSINCSLSKPVFSVVRDVESRLLKLTCKACERLEESKKNRVLKDKEVSDRKNVINSIKTVLNMSESSSGSFGQKCYKIENEKAVARIEENSNIVDSFEFQCRGLTAEQVIKIMHVI